MAAENIDQAEKSSFIAAVLLEIKKSGVSLQNGVLIQAGARGTMGATHSHIPSVLIRPRFPTASEHPLTFFMLRV